MLNFDFSLLSPKNYASVFHLPVKLSCFLSRFRPEWELYDLKADPHQLHNLAGDPAHNATLTNLKQQLMSWRKNTGDYWVCYPEGVLLGYPDHCGATYNET